MLELKRDGKELESLDALTELSKQPEDGVDMVAWGHVWQDLTLVNNDTQVYIEDLQKEFNKAVIHEERSLSSMGWDVNVIKANLAGLSGVPPRGKFTFENFWALCNTGR